MRKAIAYIVTWLLVIFENYSVHLSDLPLPNQTTQRLIPLRHPLEILCILTHQQITHHSRKHNFRPTGAGCPALSRRSVFAPIIRVRTLLAYRVYIVRGRFVQINKAQTIRVCDVECDGSFVGEVFNHSIGSGIECASG
jgi:hypothetical protein